MDTIMVELVNAKALQLLQDLEALHIIKLKLPITSDPVKLSDKYRGMLSKKDGKDLKKHIDQMRNEWSGS
jgi:hypothetical protein